jgi:hypothetical protein
VRHSQAPSSRAVSARLASADGPAARRATPRRIEEPSSWSCLVERREPDSRTCASGSRHVCAPHERSLRGHVGRDAIGRSGVVASAVGPLILWPATRAEVRGEARQFTFLPTTSQLASRRARPGGGRTIGCAEKGEETSRLISCFGLTEGRGGSRGAAAWRGAAPRRGGYLRPPIDRRRPALIDTAQL